MMKRCSTCKSEKDVEEFHKDASRKDGRTPQCKICRRRGARRYRQNNREKELARHRRWKKENPEKVRAEARRRSEENPEKERARHRRWREENRDKYNERMRRWRKENPAKGRDQNHRRRARKLVGAIGDPTALKTRMAEIYNEPCARCTSTDNIHADHIWPLSKGGAHAAFNLQPLCETCNLKKGAKLPLMLEPKTGLAQGGALT